jgi:hypothetical protein
MGAVLDENLALKKIIQIDNGEISVLNDDLSLDEIIELDD